MRRRCVRRRASSDGGTRSGRAKEEIGYGRPPKATQFQKGRSRNPRGRPKGSRREIPYDGSTRADGPDPRRRRRATRHRGGGLPASSGKKGT
ncbi:DUF5681 domain-containing protein [Acuticoccus sp. MNP-M23]|nr:DUF5681 domain-containing protein [Acuticoccus sp. MNP-M23]WMS43453.1 DUF5681 domain-containing protein [Acuticoccus sp. MNP-M23]WMS44515.1 DUF5681 domain-containing protein [Acuticoccus sp. MNP-M23]